MRSTQNFMPPPVSIQSTWSASRIRVARAGVLYVWFRRELVTAVVSDSDSGIHRSPGAAASSSARANAAGLSAATQRPPSDPNDFCGAK